MNENQTKVIEGAKAMKMVLQSMLFEKTPEEQAAFVTAQAKVRAILQDAPVDEMAYAAIVIEACDIIIKEGPNL